MGAADQTDEGMPGTFDRILHAVADRYRVERELGAGGMAHVYLAYDLRHERQVALKVLRPEIANAIGADRFLAEIRTTATLQHPHLLPLFDSGRVAAAGSHDAELLFYVMPFVEGESLRDRLARERQLPVAEATRLAAEVADALDYAHRRGILHRDIKPENILLHDGHALVADFGIALALTRAGDTTRLTGTGLSIGTPQYMSPEQAVGERQLDARTDVYALGATLYEMLTGEPPHSGATPQVVMARAATERPRPVREARPSVPAPLEAAVMTALEILPADRFATASDMARALRATDGASTRAATSAHPHPWRHILVTAGVVALVTALVTRAWPSRADRGDGPPVTASLTLPLPAGQVLGPAITPFAISRDGSLVAYVAIVGGTSQLYLRPLGSLETHALPSTLGAQGPFFSPDGQWIGYHAAGRLWKIAVAGGAPIELAEAPTYCGASWASADAIVFSECRAALHRVSSRGGDETEIAARLEAPAADSGVGNAQPPMTLRWPAVLPDGRHVLVGDRTRIAMIDLASGAMRYLFPGVQAAYLPTGHLVFDEGEGRVRLVRFDLSRLAVIGEPVPAFETFRGPASGSSFFAVSATGTLLHVAGGFSRWLVFTDRSGRPTDVAPEARGYRFPRFAPDGHRLAVTVDPRPSDIWVVDLADWRTTRVTTDGGNILPSWSSDGSRIGFTSRGFTRSVSGRGGEAHVFDRRLLGTAVYLGSWATNGTLLGFRGSEGRYDLVTLTPPDSTWRELLATPATERDPRYSPDGRWVAYSSDQSGQAEVYVLPRDGRGVGQIVSLGGGREPHWAGNGREIIFRRASSIMSVAVQTGTGVRVLGAPRELFTAEYDFSQDTNWDVTADGRRFVFVRNDAAAPRGLVVILNWFEVVRGGGNRPAPH